MQSELYINFGGFITEFSVILLFHASMFMLGFLL